MSEREPLIDERNIGNHEEFEEERLSAKTKIILYGVCGIFGILCLWLLCFWLPGLYIPTAVKLKPFKKVDCVGATLRPLSNSSVSYWGLMSPDEEEGTNSDDEFMDTMFAGESTLDYNKREVDRFILIGDIHGHLRPLKKILKKLKYNSELDLLIMLGDFITKGDDSLEVLDFAIDNNFSCILGNHEYYVLDYYTQYHSIEGISFIGKEEESHKLKIEGDSKRVKEAAKFIDDPEYLLAKKLQPKHVKYINQCSLIKKLGEVPIHKKSNNGGLHSAKGLAVHAGLRWDIEDLNAQHPLECLEMRSYIGPYFNESTDDPHAKNAVSWSKIWNKKQNALPRSNSTVVYYGHDARRGLSLKKFAKGLDTGCDKGENLTAIVIWKEKVITKSGAIKYYYKEEPISVPC